jgi:hypothetical protein
MKRNMDIIRLLLLELEADEAPPQLANYSDEEKAYESDRDLPVDARGALRHAVANAKV